MGLEDDPSTKERITDNMEFGPSLSIVDSKSVNQANGGRSWVMKLNSRRGR
jgi:hypothetical protein